MLKFRAYIKRDNVILPVDQIRFDNDSIHVDFGNGWYYYPEYELSQFAGATDINCVDIYDCDIINCEFHKWVDIDETRRIKQNLYFNHSVVIFDKGTFGIDYGGLFFALFELEKIKVVGNKWERDECIKFI